MPQALPMEQEISFHDRTKAVRPNQPSKLTTYWVGVLKTDKKPEGDKIEEDYLWIKCHSKVTIRTIREQYKNRNFPDEAITLKFGSRVPADSAVMAELNPYGDQVVALEAVKASEVQERITLARAPLQPSNHQIPASAQAPSARDPSVQPNNAQVKTDASPYTGAYAPSGFQKPSSEISSHSSRYARGSPQRDENYVPGLRSVHSTGPRSSTPLSTGTVQTPSNRGSASPLIRGAMRAISNARSTSPSIYGKSGSPSPSLQGPPGSVTLSVPALVASSTDPYRSSPPKPGDPAFIYYVADRRNAYKQALPEKTDGQIDSLLMDHWLRSRPQERAKYEAKATAATTRAAAAARWTPTPITQTAIAPLVPGSSVSFKHEKSEAAPDSSYSRSETGISDRGTPDGEVSDDWVDSRTETEQRPQTQFQIQSLLADCTPEQLELGVEKGVELLEDMKRPIIDKIPQSADAAQWVQQIENLQKQAAKTKTIVGVVGNTGAGKSSVINAMLDEERLVPTNCMRACTAVVTEISYNHERCPYRAEIEFITVADWEKELETLFQDLLDGSGNVSRDCLNEDTDAGIAYAKIKAVYPKKTKEDIANSSIEKLLQEVSYILGSSKNIEETDSLRFYKRLQHFFDSKEKSTGDKEKDKKKREKREMEFWPLIRVVRIYVKSPALSTGAVIVDLPGVHDSNAARAAVAEGYMKQCTGLWIVAPINRAVDDKAAKSLLGESFKRQLKMDGGFSSVTFICSKTDDISLMEAQDSLGLDEEMEVSWGEMDHQVREQRRFNKDLDEMKESKAIYGEIMADADEQLETWEALRDDREAGKTVFAPRSKKRKNSKGSSKQRKKQRRSSDESSEDDDHSAYEEDASTTEDEQDDDDSYQRGEHLNEEEIASKIMELRNTKKEARRQRTEIEEKMTAVRGEIEKASKAEKKIEAEMAALCISGRNAYSKGAIQQDFAAGIKELDQELAAEEDEENFNPDVEARDYEEVARSLPVFCVSSRGYQKLQGRLQKDPFVPGFKSIEETEIPQLQAHCKKLTEAGRAANCKRFLNNFSQLLNSLTMWASSDGSGLHLTAEQKAKEARLLQGSLKKLESGLEKVVQTACKELKEEFGDNIYAKYDTAVISATNEAGTTAAKWGSPVNRENRAAGGLCWSTYKAICRRNGIYSNAQGPHEWNVQLADPMLKVLASGWEKTFSRRSPAVMASFSKNAGSVLRDFHRDVDTRARKVGAGLAGLHMLQQQVRVYDDIFKDLSNTMRDTINAQQKEVNREFTPVIERAMGEAYKLCVDESGSGSFMRMKAHMNGHVEEERHTMFEQSTEEVKERLTALVRSVEEAMLNKADEVFMQIRRDYLAVLGGTEAPTGEFMPKWQRTMRQEVMEVIGGCEKAFKKVVGIEDEEDHEDHDDDVPEDDVLEDAVPEDDVKKQDEDAVMKVEQDVKIEPEKDDEKHDALGLQGTPEVDISIDEQQKESHDTQDEIKPEKEVENHDHDALGLRKNTEVDVPSLEQYKESHETQDVIMEDAPATEHADPTTTTDDGLPTIEAAKEVSEPAEITENTITEEKAPSPMIEEPSLADATTEQPNPPPVATEPAGNTSTDDSNAHHDSGSHALQDLPPSSDLANQQLENESRGIGQEVILGANDADNGSNDEGVEN